MKLQEMPENTFYLTFTNAYMIDNDYDIFECIADQIWAMRMGWA